MTVRDGVSFITLVICALTVPVWYAVGRLNQRVTWLTGVVIYPALVVLGYYVLVLFTELPDQSPEAFQLASALIRLYERGVLLVGGVMMLMKYRRERHV